MEYESSLTQNQRRFFHLVGPRLEKFAEDHNVKLQKWFKDIASWALEFRHQHGGAAQIVVAPGGDGREVYLHSAWWLDDYDSETRRLAWGKERTVSAAEPLMEDALLDEIRRVLDWTEPDLTQESKMPEGMWHSYFSREEFEMLHRSLPNPRL